MRLLLITLILCLVGCSADYDKEWDNNRIVVYNSSTGNNIATIDGPCKYYTIAPMGDNNTYLNVWCKSDSGYIKREFSLSDNIEFYSENIQVEAK